MAAVSNSLLITKNPQFRSYSGPLDMPRIRVHSRTSFGEMGSWLASFCAFVLSASHPRSVEQCLRSLKPTNLSFDAGRLRKASTCSIRRPLSVVAGYSDGGRSSSASVFIGGFLLGGVIVGTLGCVYAPQISKALAGADRKDLMRKLPKFIYDEEKALEKTRKVLAQKIEQLNSAIDDVSSQLRSEDVPNGVAVSSDEVEPAI